MARRTAVKTAAAAPLGAQTRILVLTGSEEMIKRRHLEELRQALEQAGLVQTIVFDGTSAELADVLDELRSYGLMQQHKVVIVDRADEFVSTHREPLERYAQNPVDSATLVLRSEKWNRGKLDDMIKKVGDLRKCEPPRAGEAASWLVQRAREVHARKLDPGTAALLVDRLGCSLMRLDTEVAKLALLVEPQQPITRELVEQIVGRSSEEQAWSVQEALLAALTSSDRRGGSAIAKLHELVDLAGQPDVLVAYFIADLVRKLHLAMMMRQERLPDAQIARALKLFGPREAAFMGLLRRLHPATVARLFDRIVELDVRAKTGRGTPLENLECFCAALADELN